jgi:hypothetical protein
MRFTSSSSSNRNRWIVVGACAVTWALAIALSPYVNQGPVLCPLRGFTGLPCPSCGLTRAFCALVRGDLWTAVSWNALCLPVALLLFVAPLVALYELAAGKPATFYRPWLYSGKLARQFATVVVTYHLVRCAWWAANGTLVNEFLTTSWTYRLWHRVVTGG